MGRFMASVSDCFSFNRLKVHVSAELTFYTRVVNTSCQYYRYVVEEIVDHLNRVVVRRLVSMQLDDRRSPYYGTQIKPRGLKRGRPKSQPKYDFEH